MTDETSKLSDFAKGLKVYRKENKISQKKIGDMVNLSPQVICSYENDRAVMSEKTMNAICADLGVDADYICSLKDKNLPKKVLPYEDFGERIKKCRQYLNMTQSQLAEATGLHQVQIADYERGLRKPTRGRHMQMLANALNVSEHYLDIGEGEAFLEYTKYGYKVVLKHVQSSGDKKIKLSQKYNELDNDRKAAVNELIDLLSK